MRLLGQLNQWSIDLGHNGEWRPKMSPIWQFLKDERAATSIEYALIGGLIAVVIIASLRSIGGAIQNKFYGPISNNLS
jgi:pilus assembly protein Flp/PilA